MAPSISNASFGEWLRRRRQVLDLTQATLAHRVGCATITIRKIESDERRPSRQMAARLAETLAISQEGHNRFIAVALGEQPVARLQVEDSNTNGHGTQPPLSGAAVTDEIRVVTVVAVGISHPLETRWSLRPDTAIELRDRLHAVVQGIFAEHEVAFSHSLEGSIVAFFGTPTLHEDDPERALQAALQIQNAGQNVGLPIAIGVHSGPAYLNYLQEAHIHSAFGSTMNGALRLQSQAGDGQILVSKKVYRLTRRAFEFLPFDAKFDGEAIPAAHLLLRPRQHMEKSRGIEGYMPKLVGRDQELARLEQLVNGLSNGEGAVVILSGEAGVGKSRLIAELRATTFSHKTKLHPPLWLEGRCLERTINVGYGPFLDLLRSYFAWGAEDDEPARAAQLHGVLEELVNDGHLSASEVGKLGALLGNLFALHFGNEWDDYLRQTRPEQLRQQTFQAIYTLLVAIAKRQPLLLIFEDLHWADGVSLEIIAQLMEVIPTTPLLLLCICRPEQLHRSNQLVNIASRKCLGHLAEIILRELPTRHCLQLLQAYLGDELSDNIANPILARTQGNPFFIEEMVHTLISLDLLYQEDNRWLARFALDNEIVPDTIQNLLLSRVERLTPAQKRTLYHAAVIGRHFSYQLLARVTPIQRDLDDLLWQLEEEAFLYQERTTPEVIYTFRHILTHEAIYATIPRRRLQPLHSKVAIAIERLYADDVTEHVESLAFHYERSENLPKAVDYLLKAARKAQRAYLNEEAIRYFDRALTALDRLPADDHCKELRLAALIDLGQIHYHGAAQYDEAENSFRQALALAKTMALPPRRLARILVWLGDLVMNWHSRLDESLRLGHEALTLLGDDNECNEAGWANALLHFSYGLSGRLKECNQYGLRNATFAARLICTEEYDYLIYISSACALGNIRNAAKSKWWVELGIHHATQQNHLHALAEALNLMAFLLLAEGKVEDSLIAAKDGCEMFLQAGDPKRANWCHMLMLWAYLENGDFNSLQTLAQPALAQAQLLNLEYLNDLNFCLGNAALAAGAWQEAENHFVAALQDSEPGSSSWVGLQTALGYTFFSQNKREAAINILKAAANQGLALPDIAARMTRSSREQHFPFVDTLTALDATLADPEAMNSFCQELKSATSRNRNSKVVQWHLEKAKIDDIFHKEISGIVSDVAPPLVQHLAEMVDDGRWYWHDTFGDSTIAYNSGITIHAANARDFWVLNEGAPRLMCRLQGDFAMQVACEATSSELPALGGIILGHKLTDFLRLDWGTRGPGEVTFMGYFDNQDVIIGRGRMRSDKVYLRLERRGESVRALCSDNGDEWYTVGQTEYASSGSREIGLYAIGRVDHLLYRGSYAEGTTIHFSDIHLWTRDI